MEQDNLTALVKLIMADKRIMDFIQKSMSESCDLVLIETKEIYENLPVECKTNVFCQELQNGSDGFLSYEEIKSRDWKSLKVYRPSLNLIAKLALGITDEPVLKIVQEKLIEGSKDIEFVCLSEFTKAKTNPYLKMFVDYIEKIKSFGVKVNDIATPVASNTQEVCSQQTKQNLWQNRALTEKDLLDMEKGSIVIVGKKCIITSLARDMARRKSIQICREGELV